jgi:hypothetical protein
VKFILEKGIRGKGKGRRAMSWVDREEFWTGLTGFTGLTKEGGV